MEKINEARGRVGIKNKRMDTVTSTNLINALHTPTTLDSITKHQKYTRFTVTSPGVASSFVLGTRNLIGSTIESIMLNT